VQLLKRSMRIGAQRDLPSSGYLFANSATPMTKRATNNPPKIVKYAAPAVRAKLTSRSATLFTSDSGIATRACALSVDLPIKVSRMSLGYWTNTTDESAFVT
jgi:hypothetical protein